MLRVTCLSVSKTNKWHIKLSNRTLNPKLGIRYLIFTIGFLNVQPTLCTLLPVFTFLPPPIPSPCRGCAVGPTTLAWQCNCRMAIVVIIRPIHLNYGAQVGSWYALGCLVSVTTLSQGDAGNCPFNHFLGRLKDTISVS
jgi:hypothetical protein